MGNKKKKNGPAKGLSKNSGEAAFNNPFAGLKKKLKNNPRVFPLEPPAPEEKTAPLQNEAQVFSQAMADVVPLDQRHKKVLSRTAQGKPPLLDKPVDEDLEVLAQLADLISGVGEFDLRLSGGYVQGAVPGVGPGLVERLAAGEFPLQDYLDLHHQSEDKAMGLAENFIIQAVTRGLRHVLIVHGKGKGSTEGIPILKNALVNALSRKRMQKLVLAFTTALPRDGGEGAVYVLLRRWTGPQT